MRNKIPPKETMKTRILRRNRKGKERKKPSARSLPAVTKMMTPVRTISRDGREAGEKIWEDRPSTDRASFGNPRAILHPHQAQAHRTPQTTHRTLQGAREATRDGGHSKPDQGKEEGARILPQTQAQAKKTQVPILPAEGQKEEVPEGPRGSQDAAAADAEVLTAIAPKTLEQNLCRVS
jgi:hypothetical protein